LPCSTGSPNVLRKPFGSAELDFYILHNLSDAQPTDVEVILMISDKQM